VSRRFPQRSSLNAESFFPDSSSTTIGSHLYANSICTREWFSQCQLTVSFSKVSRTDRDGKSYRLPDAEQVNDLLATTTDPGAWEFRHPLFRRGEPQLLASIKRKTTRNATQEGSVPLASPIEEYDQAKAMAGWMRDAHHGGSNRGNSPPRDREALMLTSVRRAPGYEKLSLSGSSQAESPPASGHYGAPPNLVRIPLSMDTSPQPRHQSHPSHPAATAHFSQAGFSGSPYYPQPQPSPVDMLSGQVAALEDRVQRLTDTLSTERVDNVRSHLDLTSYLLQLSGWIGESMGSCRGVNWNMLIIAPPHSDLRALQDTLNRTSADMRHKYEALMASDALASMATSDRDGRRGCESFSVLVAGRG